LQKLVGSGRRILRHFDIDATNAIPLADEIGDEMVADEGAAFKDGFFPYQGDEIKTWFEALRKRTSPDVILCHWRDTHVSCLLNRIPPRTAVISAVVSYRNCLVGLRAIRSAQ
jgi:hypothetical protein